MSSITLVHGFTQTAASFDPLVAALAHRGVAARAVDLPGHAAGEGPDRVVTGDLWSGADRLAATESGGVWLGYSMGARLVLHLALAHPGAVSAMILIGGTAGIDDPAERAARRRRDGELADRIESIGVHAFLAEWLAAPLFATMPADSGRITRRAANTAAGLASSLRRWGTGTMDPPLWDRLASITAPTLVLAGALDTKFTVLGRRLADGIGESAVFRSVPDAGHAAQIERPDAVADLVASWLMTR